jgi:hypothetical protein
MSKIPVKEKIMYSSDKAAQYKTVEGWVSSDGRFYGNNEHGARWSGCTHKICKCGNELEKQYVVCDECCDKASSSRYMSKPFKRWDREKPLVIYNTDQYFFTEWDLIAYCEDNEIDMSSLELCICVQQYAHEVCPDDLYCDILPEDTYLYDCAPELAEKFEELNKLIREKKYTLSWVQGKFRTKINSIP